MPKDDEKRKPPTDAKAAEAAGSGSSELLRNAAKALEDYSRTTPKDVMADLIGAQAYAIPDYSKHLSDLVSQYSKLASADYTLLGIPDYTKLTTPVYANVIGTDYAQLAAGANKASEAFAKMTQDWSAVLGGPTVSSLTRAAFQPHLNEFEAETSRLRNEINEKAQALLTEKAGTKKKEQQIKALEADLAKLREQQALTHILNRLGSRGQAKLLEAKDFRERFRDETPCSAFVISIDIRRSTELMLNARQPRLFAQFITSLATQLREVVLENYGVFDKFTGDGVLAFYPDFYSGDDAGFRAVQSALACQAIFAKHYDTNRHCFRSILQDVGLGIGIDYGEVEVVEIGGEFTVVGTPVVYACRMAGGNAGETYANQPAYEQLFKRYEVFDFTPVSLDIKHQGRTLAYSIRSNSKIYDPQRPKWDVTAKP